MPSHDLRITLGIEEEFFLVDPETRDLVADPDPAILEECRRNAGAHGVTTEFLRAQVETTSRVCRSVQEVRAALRETRGVVAAAAARHGASILAASTHPFGAWRDQMTTPRDRYANFETTFQDAVRRLLAGGMHVHAGFGDPDSRVRVMTAVRRHLPLLHALSTSSPFNAGHETGFKSYRLNILGALPRTGIPAPLSSWADYDDLVSQHRRMEVVRDGSEFWWDIRPAAVFPTVEMRICDICTRIEDAVSMTALYACLVRRLLRQCLAGELPPEPPTEIISENRWIAQRYGVLAFLADEQAGGRIDVADCAARLVDELAEDAEALDCAGELGRILDIVRDGSSADRQIDHYRLRRLDGDDHQTALQAVVDLIVDETLEGVTIASQ